MVFAIRPLKATKAMKIASAITSAIDHFEDSSANHFTMRFRPTTAGFHR